MACIIQVEEIEFSKGRVYSTGKKEEAKCGVNICAEDKMCKEINDEKEGSISRPLRQLA